MVTSGVLALVHSTKFDRTFGRFPLSKYGVVVLFICISATGHFGGELTHGSSYLTAYLPKPLKNLLNIKDTGTHQIKVPVSIDSVKLYSDIIQPLLNEKCVSCHNPAKLRGNLDLTIQAGILKGGLNGHAIEAGNINKSELFKRITLPEASKKVMPPVGTKPLTNVEIDLIRIWIKNGAQFDHYFSDLNPSENEEYLVSIYLGITRSESASIELPEVSQLDDELLSDLRTAGLLIDFVAEESNLIDVSFINVNTADIKNQLEKLAAIAENVYKLNLANCGLTDDDLVSLANMKNLQFLRLEHNGIVGGGLSHLTSLDQLTYLNLNNNPLNETAESHLRELSFVNKLFLWQTVYDTSKSN
jgi:hypothetical protein